MPIVSQLIACRNAEHMRVDRGMGSSACLPNPEIVFRNPAVVAGPTAFGEEDVSGFHILPT